MKKIPQMIAIVATAAFPASLAAQVAEPPGMYSYAWRDSRLASQFGITTILGGGVTGFTDETMRDSVSSSVGGLWNLRVTLGSHVPLALEVGYIGSTASIDALIGSQSGRLLGTTAEGALRFNVLPHNDWTPYALAGVGWQRYDVTGGKFNLSDTGIQEGDNSIEFPMGAGFSYRAPGGLVVDVRGVFRVNTDANVVLEGPDIEDLDLVNYAPMHSWEASAALGYYF